MTFEYKYLKYKKKYLELKYGQYGSALEEPHLEGPPLEGPPLEELPEAISPPPPLPSLIRAVHPPQDINNREYIFSDIETFQNELKVKLQSMSNVPQFNDLIIAIEEYFAGDNKKKLGKQIRGFITVQLNYEEPFLFFTLHVPEHMDEPYTYNLNLYNGYNIIGSFIYANNYKYTS